MPTSLSHELKRARAAFDAEGRIPYDFAARLIALGVNVNALEAQWSQERN